MTRICVIRVCTIVNCIVNEQHIILFMYNSTANQTHTQSSPPHYFFFPPPLLPAAGAARGAMMHIRTMTMTPPISKRIFHIYTTPYHRIQNNLIIIHRIADAYLPPHLIAELVAAVLELDAGGLQFLGGFLYMRQLLVIHQHLLDILLHRGLRHLQLLLWGG